MSQKTAIISHFPAMPYTLLQPDYLIICGGNYCAAKILALFEGWSKSKQDAIEQAKYHNQAAAKEGLEATQDETTWLYNSLENLRLRMLGEYSVKTIEKALQRLVELGFIKTRFNPKLKWDRTKQYQFQIQAVQTAIYQITREQIEEYISPKPETLDFLHSVNLSNGFGIFTQSIAHSSQIESANLPDGSSKNTKAIPKSHNKESIQKNTPITTPFSQNSIPSVCVEKENGADGKEIERSQERDSDSSSLAITSPFAVDEENSPGKKLDKEGQSSKKMINHDTHELNKQDCPSLSMFNESPTLMAGDSNLEKSSAATPNNHITIQLITNLVMKALADFGVKLAPQPLCAVSRQANQRVAQKANSVEQKKVKADKNPSLCEFQQWKQQIDPQEWEAFLGWKASQAPANVRDGLAWAYNTLKGNSERARLSFESFQREKTQSSNPPSKPDQAPNFQAWEMGQHIELAKEYIAKNIAFFKEQPWHCQWVEYINATFPNLFIQVQQGGFS